MKDKEVDKEREKIREKDAEKDKEKDKEHWQGGQWCGSQSKAEPGQSTSSQRVTEVGRLWREMGAPSHSQDVLALRMHDLCRTRVGTGSPGVKMMEPSLRQGWHPVFIPMPQM